MHKSVPVEMPVEFIDITPVNPLISKCQIKVCYVSDAPNRNRSVITKEVARKMANTLPGNPIVGYYNEHKGDFEEHNRAIEISNGEFKIKDTTRPYGFVDLNAKVWFAKYMDDDGVEREYLVTEGWLWTGQYPECARILENRGNNHSMELNEETLDATWTKDNNGKPKFFIINEAVIEKLCILGEDCEPCFEGSHITAPKMTYSLGEDFKQQLFSMMNELKELISEGGANKLFTRYAVEIGDTLWSALYGYIEANFPDGNNNYCSMYRIDGIYEENGQKFAILQGRNDLKYYRLNFALDEAVGFSANNTLIEVTKSYTPSAEPQFDEEAVQSYEIEFAKKNKQNEDKDDKEDNKKTDDTTEGDESEKDDKDSSKSDESEEDEEDKKKKKGKFAKDKDDEDENEEKCPECGKPMSECTCEKKKEEKKSKYNLEEVVEYAELSTKYSDLETQYQELLAEHESLKKTLAPLTEFKAQAELKDKQEMINSFYMLSDEDKQDVIDNINTYSLDDIESKLSVICVRNKVSFNLDDDTNDKGVTTFSLNNDEDDVTPAWVKRALSVAKSME